MIYQVPSVLWQYGAASMQMLYHNLQMETV